MLFERIEARGLAHNSYIVGDGTRAVVVDPRRDCDIYVELASREGMRITHILETHRNEDYVIGSVELAAKTGAEVLHSAYDELPYAYGGRISEDAPLRIGALRMEPIHTPGHTRGHMSYLLRDPTGAPWVVFTGDALFAGDVGRCDFYGEDKLHEMTGLLYDSVFHKLLPLGDGVIVAPAHGSGSACATAIAERPWTTIGLERLLNPRLQHTTKDEFVRHAARVLEYPHYFRMMERLNLEGAPLLCTVPPPRALSAKEFDARARDALVLDTRWELGFNSAHVPGALSIWEIGLSGWAGWFLPYDEPILLVTDTNDVSPVMRVLSRLGFDRVEGFLAGGMISWHSAGLPSQRISTVTVQDLCGLLDGGKEAWILDVRSAEEVQEQAVPRAHHIHLSYLPERMTEVPRDRPVHIFCGSGVRSTVAAGLLQRAGYESITVVLGGLSAWDSHRCPLR
jgi:hydroxyacylglutathione hydrolase